MGTAVYLHIPFCVAKCSYCDFLSFPETDPAKHRSYLQALVRELELWGQKLRAAGCEAATLYLGGGTPTVLSAADLEWLLAACRRLLPLAQDVEWTVEANPCTLTQEKIGTLAAGGVNRISLGIQDLNEERLALLGRRHTAAQARQALLACKDYFPSVSVDLMTALPGQTTTALLATLAAVCDLGPHHLSLYGLQLEEGTALQAMAEAGEISLPDEDAALAMFIAAREYLLKQGFVHYEIANYARPGHCCRHNLTYWRNLPYFGLGLGAHTFWEGKRLVNTCCLENYQRELAAGKLPVAEILPVSLRQEMEDTMMLGLRLREGVSLQGFRQRFGVDLSLVFAPQLARLQELGLLVCDGQKVCLTAKGLPVANTVIAEFISP
ncbi:MAG: radical SAM family heme chaperone HemW [Firmicutes bacterium]|jgi:oxygen-independent coproporphyrinogen-3 oxidase|nr:radical SAM family heme chaperone HemW [Bacillota bacterium]